MLQRVRDGISSLTAKSDDDGNGDGTRVNVVHRLDRGASGCLLFAFADEDDSMRSSTAVLQEALASANATKTYLALVRGEGILRGDDLKARGWFLVDRENQGRAGPTEQRHDVVSICRRTIARRGERSAPGQLSPGPSGDRALASGAATFEWTVAPHLGRHQPRGVADQSRMEGAAEYARGTNVFAFGSNAIAAQ